MADTFFIEGLNTLPEQVQLNKDDIKKLSDSNTTQTEQLQALTTKVDTNTANIATNTSNIATNATDIDNLSKKVYDNGSLSFRLGTESKPSIQVAFFRDSRYPNRDLSIQYATSSPKNKWMIQCDPSDDVYFNFANINHATVSALYFWNSGYITGFSDSDVDDNHQGLTAHAINQYYLKKTDASNTYATKHELSNTNNRIDALDTGTFDVDLTTSGLAKIQANVSIGTPITLTKNTDFSEYLDYTNYKTVIFTLYMNDDEEYFISTDIKLNVGDTADVYGDNEQNYTWLTGIGVIKLGPNQVRNNYLCYISYSQGYTSPLVITPIQKLA